MSQITYPKCENKINPINIDTKKPRFSWQIRSELDNVYQEWYRITVREERATAGTAGKCREQSFGVRYAGRPLASRENYT